MDIKTIASSSSGCCYLIESGGEQLLIECGISLKKIREALDFDLSRVVGCLVSHEHKDHCSGLPAIEAFLPIPIYGPDIFGAHHNTVTPEHVFRCGSKFTAKPLLLEHDVECFGYVVKAGGDLLFYATDTGEINYTIPGLTHLMIEANYSFNNLLESSLGECAAARISENHLGLAGALHFAERHKETLKEVHLLHLSDRHSDEKEFKRLAQEALGIPVYIAQKRFDGV